MLTLWDLLDPLLNRLAPQSRPPAPKPQRVDKPARPITPTPPTAPTPIRLPRAAPAAPITTAPTTPRRRTAASEAADASMQAKYDAVVELMLARYNIRVRKWRSAMSGVAWYVTYRDGRRVNLIESPRPKGPMSAAVFLHEIGHHAIGFDVYKPRCLEEYHAWRFSLEAMQEHGLNITDQVRYRMHQSLWYAVSKAKRRGIKQIPDELLPFQERAAKPAKPRKTRAK